MGDFLLKVLLIRFRQSYRVLKSVGWGYVVLLAPLLLFIFGFRLLEVLTATDPYSGGLLLLLPALSVHFSRKDHFYLQQISTYPERWGLFFLEYLLMMLVLLLPLLIYGKLMMVGVCLLGMFLLAGFDKKWTPQMKWRSLSFNWIPIRAFEWRSGFRRVGLLVAFFWVIGFAASHWVWGIPGVVIIVAFFCASFYELLEPKEFLEEPFTPSRILWQKIGLHLGIFNLLFSVHYLVFFIRHWDLWWILVLTIVAVGLLLSFAILVKYANWLPRREKHTGQTMLAIFALGLLVPFLAPASLGLWGYYYFKARKRINYFYHA